MEPSTLISVIVPIYREEHNVRPLAERLAAVFDRVGCRWELVFALDPSPDRTRERIDELIREDYPVRLVMFSRRIGKPLSVMAGLDHCRGDACVIIDADLQDPPELIADMIAKWREGYKVVIAQRSSRKGENLVYLAFAGLFYRLLDLVSEVKVPRDTGDFRLLDGRVVAEVRRFRERHGFLRGITAAAGFPTAIIPFDRDRRHAGKTQISFLGAFNIALDGLVPFSRAPMRLMLFTGLIWTVAAVIAGIIWLGHGLAAGFGTHWALEILGIVLAGGIGLVVTGMGVLGEYLVRTYEEARDRPLYIVDEVVEARSALSGALGRHPESLMQPKEPAAR
ncbi:MAG: glycosyltransferase family 2 protein [Desulfomonile sp.]|nr:glycosyltransferase family 2 protein [Desulfomonile sp.]